MCQNFSFQICLLRTAFRISDYLRTRMYSYDDDSNNVHFACVRFIFSPYLAIKSAFASLGPGKRSGGIAISGICRTL